MAGRVADVITVKKMVDHADPATTSRYDRRGKRAQHKAASPLLVPYERRLLDAPGTDDAE